MPIRRHIPLLPLVAALTAAGPAFAGTLIATDFTGSAVISGTTVGGIVWTGDSHLSGGSSTTLATSGSGTITGALFTYADNNDRISANINVQTAAGYTSGNPVWTSDYTIGYAFTGAGDSLALGNVTFTAFALSSTPVIQGSARTVAYAVQILSSDQTLLATGQVEQAIPGSSTAGITYTLTITGTTTLTSAVLDGDSGSFILRVSALKPSTSEGGTFTAYDNLSLNGDYIVGAVPEPSAYGLLGVSALAGVALVRRRRKMS